MLIPLEVEGSPYELLASTQHCTTRVGVAQVGMERPGEDRICWDDVFVKKESILPYETKYIDGKYNYSKMYHCEKVKLYSVTKINKIAVHNSGRQ